MDRRMSQSSLSQDQAKFGSKNALNRRVTTIQLKFISIDQYHIQCFVGVYSPTSMVPNPTLSSLTKEDEEETWHVNKETMGEAIQREISNGWGCNMSHRWKNDNNDRQAIIEIQI